MRKRLNVLLALVTGKAIVNIKKNKNRRIQEQWENH